MAQNWYGAGELWKKEVKSVRASAETRKEFYGDKALRKVGEKLLGDVSGLNSDDLTAKLKEHAEITKDDAILAGKWDPEKIRAKRYISDILKDFFVQKCGSKRGTADALIALKFLNEELENVDLVREGEIIDIENGILTIKSRGEVVARGAIVARAKLPAGSPDALPRRGAVRRKSRSARAAIAATLPPTPSASVRGTTAAPIVPEPAGPGVAPPLAPPPSPPVAAAPRAPAPPVPPRALPPLAPPRAGTSHAAAPAPPPAPPPVAAPRPALPTAPPPLPPAPPLPAAPRTALSPAPPVAAPDVLAARLKKRAQEVEDALKAEPRLKPLAHEIALIDEKGPDAKLVYFKITLRGSVGAPHDIGFLGIHKTNTDHIVLEDTTHKQLGSFDNVPAFTQFAADPKNLTWGGGAFVLGAIPPAPPPAPPAAPPAPPAARPSASPPPIAPAATGRPSPAPPGAVPPPLSATIDPFAARAAAAPKAPENDPDKLSIIVDGAWKAKNWDDLDVAAYLLLTNPKSTPEQQANAHLRLIDAYKARNKVDQAIESYRSYLHFKPKDTEKCFEGVKYAFENKKYQEVLELQLSADLTTHAYPSNATEIMIEILAGDAGLELKRYDIARFYWKRALARCGSGSPAQFQAEKQVEIQAKLDKLPKAP